MENYNVETGIDLGNGYCKFGGMKFATKTSAKKLLNIGNKRDEVHAVHYNGVDYTVGDGKSITGDNKYTDPRYKLCLLTAIALKGGRRRNIRAKICLGLPITNFDRLSEIVKKEIQSWDVETITVNGAKYTIEIVEVDFFIEGALAILKEDPSHMLTIDIGAGTVNVIEWEGMSPIKYDTYDASINSVYSSMKSYLNINHGGSFKTADVEKLVEERITEKKIKGENVDISNIYVMIDEFVSGVVADMIESGFRIDQVDKIKIFGGGAYTTAEYWDNYLPSPEVVKNAQFVNSEVFNLIVKM